MNYVKEPNQTLESGSSRHAVPNARKLRSNHRTIDHLSVSLNLKAAEVQSEWAMGEGRLICKSKTQDVDRSIDGSG